MTYIILSDAFPAHISSLCFCRKKVHSVLLDPDAPPLLCNIYNTYISIYYYNSSFTGLTTRWVYN